MLGPLPQNAEQWTPTDEIWNGPPWKEMALIWNSNEYSLSVCEREDSNKYFHVSNKCSPYESVCGCVWGCLLKWLSLGYKEAVNICRLPFHEVLYIGQRHVLSGAYSEEMWIGMQPWGPTVCVINQQVLSICCTFQSTGTFLLYV